MKYLFGFLLFVGLVACQSKKSYDVVLKNGTVYDGLGGKPIEADVAISADTIAAIGKPGEFSGEQEIDVKGLAVAPGFINMLSWATTSLIQDGRSLGDIKQGVTLEVMGEGNSMGPLTQPMKESWQRQIDKEDVKFQISWNTLGEYLNMLEKKGVSCNVASFIGAATPRLCVLGPVNRAPKPDELEKMRAYVRQAMEEGAMGVASALIYVPGIYSRTDELIALAEEASKYGGMYVSHMRSEGNQIEFAVEELITIAKKAKIRSEIYHLKFAGKQNWGKIDKVLARIDQANKDSLHITADMYTYVAGATGLDAAMPPDIQEGTFEDWQKRLQDPAIRKRVIQEMKAPGGNWENLYFAAGPDKVLFLAFLQDSLRKYQGKTLAEVAKIRGKSPEETAMDLVIQDGTRVEVAYFLMNEDNIKRQLKLPYLSFCSDASSMAPEGVFLKTSAHPRAYGNFARLLGKYVRDEKVIPLEDAIRKLTSLPASNLRIQKRGSLQVGNYADVVVFDPQQIQDHATFEKPHQLATGMVHVFVNGKQVLNNGEHTGAKPGRFVKGPGFKAK
ncbi:MAG: D-aminoacylase [Spirosomataceae bacterium]